MQVQSGVGQPVADTRRSRNPFATVEAWRVPSERRRSTKRIVGPIESTGTPWTPRGVVDELASRGLRVIARGGYWMVQCPAPGHDDNEPSCKVAPGRRVPVIVKCHAGCAQTDVLEAIGAPSGWRAQPSVLRFPQDPDDCLCLWHRWNLEWYLEEQEEVLTPELRADVLRCFHAEQRSHIKRIVAHPRAHPRALEHLVLLGDFSIRGAALRATVERLLSERDPTLREECAAPATGTNGPGHEARHRRLGRDRERQAHHRRYAGCAVLQPTGRRPARRGRPPGP